MKKLFYRIWVDAIVNIRKNPQHKNNWKFYSMFIMTLLVAINVMTVLMWIGYGGANFGLFQLNLLEIDFFPGTMLDSFAMFLLQFAFPSFLLNFFSIFHRDRYKRLIVKYSDRKGKALVMYMFITIGLFIIPVLFYWWLR